MTNYASLSDRYCFYVVKPGEKPYRFCAQVNESTTGDTICRLVDNENAILPEGTIIFAVDRLTGVIETSAIVVYVPATRKVAWL